MCALSVCLLLSWTFLTPSSSSSCSRVAVLACSHHVGALPGGVLPSSPPGWLGNGHVPRGHCQLGRKPPLRPGRSLQYRHGSSGEFVVHRPGERALGEPALGMRMKPRVLQGTVQIPVQGPYKSLFKDHANPCCVHAAFLGRAERLLPSLRPLLAAPCGHCHGGHHGLV